MLGEAFTYLPRYLGIPYHTLSTYLFQTASRVGSLTNLINIYCTYCRTPAREYFPTLPLSLSHSLSSSPAILPRPDNWVDTLPHEG